LYKIVNCEYYGFAGDADLIEEESKLEEKAHYEEIERFFSNVYK